MTSPSKKYQWEVDNRMHAFGDMNSETKKVRVNKKKHKSQSAKGSSPKPNGDEHLGKTIFHEDLHIKHPKWTEKQVRKHEKDWAKLSPKEKKRYYSKLNKSKK